jgi:hypothetical protein
MEGTNSINELGEIRLIHINLVHERRELGQEPPTPRKPRGVGRS